MTPRNNRDVNTRSKIKGKVSKLLVSTALLGPVVLPPIVASEWLNPQEASAASVADIDVLTQTNVNATLNEPPEGEDYRLQLNVNTGSVAGLDVVGTDQRVIVHSDDLAGLWYPIEGETATVTVQILPITMDNLPVVNDLLTGILGNTTNLINEVLGLVNGPLVELLNILAGIPFAPSLTIEGVDELGQALDALNNLPNAIAEILEVTIADAPITEGPNGEMVVDFSDGLAQHLNAAINDVVLQTVNNLISAINAFNIDGDLGLIGALPAVGSGLQEALDRALEIDDLLTGLLSGLTNEIVDPIVNGTLDVVSDLAAVEVIGQTTADFAVGIQNPAGLSGEVPVYGGMVSDDFIDISLLNQGENFANIYFDEEIDEEPDYGQPTVNLPITADDTEITGTVDFPEVPVYVQIDEGEPQPATVDADGNFTFPVEDLEEGTVITVFQEDEDGNQSEPNTVTVEAGEGDPGDEELLAPPVVDDYYHTDPEITGTVDPENAGYDVIIRDEGGEEIGRTTPGEDGNFSIPVEDLEPGQELEVVQVDAEGNDVSDPTPIEVLDGEEDSGDEDEDPTDPDQPTPPTDPEYPGGPDEDLPPFDLGAPTVYPISAGDLFVGGQRRSDATLIAIANGEEVGRLEPRASYGAGEDADFTMRLLYGLEEGTSVRFYQEDMFGRRSPSTYVTVGAQEDTDLPELVAPTVNPITVGDETATGNRDASMPLYALIDGQVIATLPANPEAGSDFELDLPEGLNAGTAITFYQVDAAGRQTPSTTVVVQNEEGEVPADTALPQPEVNPISSATQVLTGRRVGNATLEVIVNDEVIETLQPDEAFASDDPSVITMTDFEIELDETFPAGTEVTFIQSDEFGRTSEPVTVTVESEVIIAPPEVDSKYEGDPVITGRKAQGSRVYARLSSEDYIGDNYSNEAETEEQAIIPSLLRNAVASFSSEESDEVIVEVLAETANILLEDPLLPNGTEFEVQLSDEFPAGTTIELYQVNEFEGEEITSEPTQIVVQPTQEPVGELLPVWLDYVSTTTEYLYVWVHSNDVSDLNYPVEFYRNGQYLGQGIPETQWSGDFAILTFPLESGLLEGDTITAYRVAPDGRRSPAATRIVEGGYVNPPYMLENIRTTHEYHYGYFEDRYDYEARINGGDPIPLNIDGPSGYQLIPALDLEAGDIVQFYSIGVWGVRSEPVTFYVEEFQGPYIYRAASGDTVIYVQPHSGIGQYGQEAPVHLTVNGEPVETRLFEEGHTDRYTFVLDEPLNEGDEIEAYHYSEINTQDFVFDLRETLTSSRTTVHVSEYPERELDMPPLDMYHETEDLEVPIVNQPIMDTDTVITGEYTGRGLIVIREDTEEVLFYLENNSSFEENIPFEIEVEGIPGGTSLHFLSVDWPDIQPLDEAISDEDILYWWNEDSVVRSLPAIATVQVTPPVIDSIITDLGVTTVTGESTADEVVLYVDGQEVAVIPVEGDGTFNTVIDVPIPAGTTVEAFGRMVNGAVSLPTTFDNITEVIAQPILDAITERDTAITGAVANDDVPIVIEIGGTIVESEWYANEDGTFSYSLDETLAEGTLVRIWQEGQNITSNPAQREVLGVDVLPEPSLFIPNIYDSHLVVRAAYDYPVHFEIDGVYQGEAVRNEEGYAMFELTEPLEEDQTVRAYYVDDEGYEGLAQERFVEEWPWDFSIWSTTLRTTNIYQAFQNRFWDLFIQPDVEYWVQIGEEEPFQVEGPAHEELWYSYDHDFSQYPEGTEVQMFIVDTWGRRAGESQVGILESAEGPTIEPVEVGTETITVTRNTTNFYGNYIRIYFNGEVIYDEPANYEYVDDEWVFAPREIQLPRPLETGDVLEAYEYSTQPFGFQPETETARYELLVELVQPEVTEVSSDGSVIYGTGIPDIEVVVEDEVGNVIGRGLVDSEGNYAIDLAPPVVEGQVIELYHEDGERQGERYEYTVPALADELLPAPVVNDVVHTDTEIVGMVNPENAGYDVIVRDAEGTEIGRVTPNADGSFAIPVEGLEPGQVLEVLQVDAEENEVSEATPVPVGEADPELFPEPQIDDVVHTDTAITGMVDPESAEYDVILRNAAGIEIGRATPMEDGSFTISVQGLEPGQVLTAVQLDETGAEVSGVAVITVGEGEEDPGEPELFPEPQVDDVVHTDDAITGTVDPENAGYEVIVRDSEENIIGRAMPNDDGTFTIPVEGLEPGQELEVVQVDEDGNDVSDAAPITVGEGEEDPTDPELFPEPQVDDVVHTDGAITGTVDPENAGYDVIVRDEEGNEIGRVTPNEDGSFTIPVEGLEPGQELEVVQVDEDGNDVSEATPITVGEDDDVPSDPDLLDPPHVNEVSDTDTEVTGTVDPENAGYDVIIRDPEGNEIGRATPDDEGNFTIPVEGLEPGQELEVVQVDEDGNDVSNPTPITVGEGDEEDDPTDPELLTPPTVDDVDHTDTEVTGTVDPENVGYDVIIRDPEGNEIGRATPDEDGNSSIPVEGLEPGQELEVVQVDEDGNDVSQPTPITVGEGEDDGGIDPIIEDIPAPTLNPITDQDTVITGEATEDTMAVVLYVNGVEIARISPEEFNSPFEYSLDGPLPAGTVVQARHINSEGELGGVATRIVTSTETPTDPDPIPAPDVDEPQVGDEGISGVVADPSRPVVIIVGEDRYEVMPNPDGSFHLDLDEPLRPGTVVTIFQVDEDGHPGESVTFVVGEGLVSRDTPETSRESQRRTFGERLPDTATTVWTLGAAGLGLTLLGLATKVMKKFKK